MTQRRWLQIGAALSVTGIVTGVVLSAEFPHRYSGGTVVIRSWLVALSCAIAVPSLLGAACMAKAAPWPFIRWLFGGAALCWAAHAALIGALIDQPIAPDSIWIWALTTLVCLPSLLRALALWTSHFGRFLATIDAVIIIVVWWQTPVEVLARGHVAQAGIWACVPCVLALIAVAASSDV